MRLPSGGYRLFYTAVGPAKPYPNCQGYILSAVSEDGLNFQKEPGIRLAPQPKIPHMSLRVISPSVTACADGRWRMYFESRGSADIPTVICSAISTDMLNWELEAGIRLQAPGGVGGVRYMSLPDESRSNVLLRVGALSGRWFSGDADLSTDHECHHLGRTPFREGTWRPSPRQAVDL